MAAEEIDIITHLLDVEKEASTTVLDAQKEQMKKSWLHVLKLNLNSRQNILLLFLKLSRKKRYKIHYRKKTFRRPGIV